MGARFFAPASRAVAAAAAAVSWGLLVGCGASPPVDDGGVTVLVVPADAAAPVDDAAQTDAGLDRALPTSRGSPLCGATWVSCYPDDLSTATARWCNLAPDGGAYQPSQGYDLAQLACRVEDDDGGVAPACAPAGPAGDGEPCARSSDCAAGFECVGGGTCRRYCCSGVCADESDFCDIQPTIDFGPRVPVCTPMHACALLDVGDAGSCSPFQTCAVVRNDGATSCVTIGPRQAGEECDTNHCARDLTCLGNPGDRVCYALCHTNRTGECPHGQTCQGGLPLFPVYGVGICK